MSVIVEPLHCATTGNRCGTDTWAEGYTCPCTTCQQWLYAFSDGLEAAALFVDEVIRRATGRAREPIDLRWLAERLRAMKHTPPERQ